MKRLKSLFVLLIVLIMGFAVNVNADTYKPTYLFGKGSSVIKSGDVIEIYSTGSTYIASENMNGYDWGIDFHLSFDKDIFEFVSCEVSPNDYEYWNQLNVTTDVDLDNYIGNLYVHYYGNGYNGNIYNGNYNITYKFQVKDDVYGKNAYFFNYYGDYQLLGELQYTIYDNDQTSTFKSANNYLSSIDVNGESCYLSYYQSTGFVKEVEDYYVYCDEALSKINITTTTDDPNATVLGDGEFKLKTGENKFNIMVTSQDGNPRIYSLKLYAYYIPEDENVDTTNNEPADNEVVDNDNESTNTNEKVSNPINIYLFRGEGCPHCESLKEFFNSIENEYGKYYNLIEFEIWNDESNNALMYSISYKMGDNVTGVPYLIIGDKSWNGYEDDPTLQQDIKDSIMKLYNSNKRFDVFTSSFPQRNENSNYGDTVLEEEKNNNPINEINLYLVVGMGICLLLAIILLILYATSKKDDDKKSE